MSHPQSASRVADAKNEPCPLRPHADRIRKPDKHWQADKHEYKVKLCYMQADKHEYKVKLCYMLNTRMNTRSSFAIC
jgi:hypothetical protein